MAAARPRRGRTSDAPGAAGATAASPSGGSRAGGSPAGAGSGPGASSMSRASPRSPSRSSPSWARIAACSPRRQTSTNSRGASGSEPIGTPGARPRLQVGLGVAVQVGSRAVVGDGGHQLLGVLDRAGGAGRVLRHRERGLELALRLDHPGKDVLARRVSVMAIASRSDSLYRPPDQGGLGTEHPQVEVVAPRGQHLVEQGVRAGVVAQAQGQHRGEDLHRPGVGGRERVGGQHGGSPVVVAGEQGTAGRVGGCSCPAPPGRAGPVPPPVRRSGHRRTVNPGRRGPRTRAYPIASPPTGLPRRRRCRTGRCWRLARRSARMPRAIGSSASRMRIRRIERRSSAAGRCRRPPPTCAGGPRPRGSGPAAQRAGRPAAGRRGASARRRPG